MKNVLFRPALTLIPLLAIFLVGCEGGEGAGSTSLSSTDSSGSNGTIVKPSSTCVATDASIVALNHSDLQISGQGSVHGNIYIDSESKLKLSGQASVGGSVYKGTGVAVQISGQAQIRYGIKDSAGDLSAQVKEVADKFAARTADVEYTGISSSLTINGNGGIKVIHVLGDLDLSGQSKLTLNGTADDVFVFNVDGKAKVAGQAEIVLAGEVDPRKVVFNLRGANSDFSLSGQGKLVGTFISPNGASITGKGRLAGAIAAGGKILISGQGFAFMQAPFCYTPPTPNPDPTPSPTPNPDPTPSPTPNPNPTPTPTPDPNPTPTPTPTPDPTAAVISGFEIAESTQEGDIYFVWSTDVAATTEVVVKNLTTGAESTTVIDSGYTTGHLAIVNLDPSNSYEVRAKAKTATGAVSTSDVIRVY